MHIFSKGFLHQGGIFSRYKTYLLPGSLGAIFLAAVFGGYLLYQFEKRPITLPQDTFSLNAGKIPQEWLIRYFATDDENAPHVGGPDADPDDDVLTNLQEYYFFTDPTNDDSDGDGQIDGAEVAVNSNPNGTGEIYSTELASKVADQFVVTYNLDEFKKENIEKQVLALLRPPKPEDVIINLPETKLLKVIPEKGSEVAAAYLDRTNQQAQVLRISEETISHILNNPSDPTNQLTPVDVYQTVSKYQTTPVPTEFVRLHQLQMAVLGASAKILEVGQKVDFDKELEDQAIYLQEQFYQVAVITKANQLILEEAQRLGQTYDVLKQFNSGQ